MAINAQDVRYDSENNVFIVSPERYRLFVQSEMERDIAFDLIDIKDKKIENLENRINKYQELDGLRIAMLNDQQKEINRIKNWNYILGGICIAETIVILIESLIIAF